MNFNATMQSSGQLGNDANTYPVIQMYILESSSLADECKLHRQTSACTPSPVLIQGSCVPKEPG